MQIRIALAVLFLAFSSVIAAQEECMDCFQKSVERTPPGGDPYTEYSAFCCDAPCEGDGFAVEDWDVGAGCAVSPVSWGGGDTGTVCTSGTWDQDCPERTSGGPGDPNYDDSGPDPDDAKQQSPIILALGDGTYRLTSVSAGVRFDFEGNGASVQTAWTRPGAGNAFLAFDRNGNGAIDDGGELFGNNTSLITGERASNGFIALAELDSSGDGAIDAVDAAWPMLLLWTDHDHDGRSGPGELQPLAGSGVIAIETAYRFVGRRDQWGNTFRYMAHFRTSGGRVACYDVFLETH
jgi:hypothetical protein